MQQTITEAVELTQMGETGGAGAAILGVTRQRIQAEIILRKVVAHKAVLKLLIKEAKARNICPVTKQLAPCSQTAVCPLQEVDDAGGCTAALVACSACCEHFYSTLLHYVTTIRRPLLITFFACRRTPNTGRARAGNAAKTAPQKRGTITASGDVTPASISPSSNTAAEDPTAEQQAPASDTEQVQAGATPQADHKQKHRTHTVEDARDKARTENMTVATKRATEQQKANAEAEEQFGQGTVVSVEQEVQQQQRQQWHKEQKQELEQKPQKQAQEQKQQKHEQEQKQQKQAQEQKQQKQKVVPATVQVQVPNQATEVQNLPLAVKSTADVSCAWCAVSDS